MFGLFKPTCPCDPAAKDWVERRLQWLVDEFDDTAFTGRPVVLAELDGEGVAALRDRLAGRAANRSG